MDVLIADSPKLHFRRPDVVVYRCIDDDRGRWGRKPIAADCLIAVEIVSSGKRWTKACKPGSTVSIERIIAAGIA
jgi:hypothetical protein